MVLMWLRTTSGASAGSSIVYGEVGVVCSVFELEMLPPRGGVMTMTPVCYRDEALIGGVCVWGI